VKPPLLNIYYITQTGLFGSRSYCENFSATLTLDLLFPSPDPPRKTSTTYPKMPHHQDLLITNVLTQVQIP
jgi:hypothetical protein